MVPSLRVAEFFAGIGLVRAGLEKAGFEVVFANDLSATKLATYIANYGGQEFLLRDIADVAGDDIPDVELATGSFPCTDLSLAGWRRGLAGEHSGTFWEFARILEEMGARRPPAILVENVPGFATSHGGADLAAAIGALNSIGYVCDVLVVNAKHFLPQSRLRLFIVGTQASIAPSLTWRDDEVHPAWLAAFADRYPDLALRCATLPAPPARACCSLSDLVSNEDNDPDLKWWTTERVANFIASLSPIQTARLEELRRSLLPTHVTAYRRTRNGRTTWEIRRDGISGCLRAVRGGSSRQALVECAAGEIRIRWMTPLEYARLQGVPDFKMGNVTESQALFGFGDAVCVPVIEWLAINYLKPFLDACGLTKIPIPRQVVHA